MKLVITAIRTSREMQTFEIEMDAADWASMDKAQQAYFAEKYVRERNGTGPEWVPVVRYFSPADIKISEFD